MSVTSIFKYGELEINIDMADYIFLEKYEQAIEEYAKTSVKAQDLKKNSEIIKAHVNAVFDVFDNALGSGSAKLVLGSTTSLAEAQSALKSFFEFVSVRDKEQGQEMIKMAKEITTKKP